MEGLGIILLVILAVGPFVIAIKMGPKQFILKEPPVRLEGTEITVFPTCYHCGWKGALDVTDFVKASPVMMQPTIMKSPPCRNCGQRWLINLTRIVEKYKTEVLA